MHALPIENMNLPFPPVACCCALCLARNPPSLKCARLGFPDLFPRGFFNLQAIGTRAEEWALRFGSGARLLPVLVHVGSCIFSGSGFGFGALLSLQKAVAGLCRAKQQRREKRKIIINGDATVDVLRTVDDVDVSLFSELDRALRPAALPSKRSPVRPRQRGMRSIAFPVAWDG